MNQRNERLSRLIRGEKEAAVASESPKEEKDGDKKDDDKDKDKEKKEGGGGDDKEKKEAEADAKPMEVELVKIDDEVRALNSKLQVNNTETTESGGKKLPLR